MLSAFDAYNTTLYASVQCGADPCAAELIQEEGGRLYTAVGDSVSPLRRAALRC